MVQWGISGTVIFGTFRQIKEAISYISELDNALNEIRIVTNKTQEEVNQLGLSYNKLAKEMSVTTREIASTAADLFRQGLNDSQVEERMKAIIQYAKISSISLEESNKIITATANATGESVQKIIDVFAYLGDATASGADEIGEALQRVASAAENSNISLEKSVSWIATISSITRESASTIGRSLNSVISRYEQIKKTGFNKEDATKLNDVVQALSQVGIVATDSQGQLRDFTDVMDELGAKYNSLSKNEQAYIATVMFGTYQRNRGITLLRNYNDSLKNYEAALNSAGTAEQKFAIYQESTQAKLDKLRATIEDLYDNFISSDFLKGAIDSFTGFLNIIDRTSAELGGFGTILMFLTTGVLIKFTASLFSAAKGAGIIETALVALQLGIKGISTALLGLLTNPVTWLITAIGAITVGIMAWANHQQKLKEQIEATNKAQSDFNKIIDEFNKTLDIQKINEAAQALEQLKQATNYDESVKQIQKLKEEIAQLESSNTTRSARGYTYGVNDATIAIKKKQLAELEEKIKSVTEAEKKYNEAQKIGNALDYESVNAQTKKIAATLREISENEKLFGSYKEVNGEKKRIPGLYDEIIRKLKAGEKLTEEEIALNNKLLDQYPEYTRLINEKTGALGVSLEALDANTQAQKALATVELTTLKETARARRIETDNIIKDTERQIESYEARIKAIEAADLALRMSDPEEYARRAGGHSLYKSMLSEYMNEARKKLANAKLAESAWKTLENIDVDNLLKSQTKFSSGYFAKDKDEDKSKSTEIYEAEINQFQQLEDALAKVNDEIERNRVLTDLAEEKDKINLLSKRIDLYKEEQKILHQLAEARRSVIQQNVGKLQGLGFDIFYDRNANELVIRNMERLNQLKGKDAEATNK
ncbi:MAG: phage tail tape measure protein, partial [Thermacetogeniaceae bacterium]